MTAVSEAGVKTGPCDGTVAGAPRRWLRLEGATLLGGTLVAFSTTHRSWWLIPLVLFLPDLFAAGYICGSRMGANLYNVAHATPFPTLLVGLGWWQHNSIVLVLGLVWLSHIGMDRVLGFGLKYPDHPGHTHLGSKSRTEAQTQQERPTHKGATHD